MRSLLPVRPYPGGTRNPLLSRHTMAAVPRPAGPYLRRRGITGGMPVDRQTFPADHLHLPICVAPPTVLPSPIAPQGPGRWHDRLEERPAPRPPPQQVCWIYVPWAIHGLRGPFFCELESVCSPSPSNHLPIVPSGLRRIPGSLGGDEK